MSEQAKQQITISGVLALLEQGMKRKEVYAHYGLSETDGKKLFKHPKLKGRKPLKQTPFVLVDDTEVETIQDSPQQSFDTQRDAGDQQEEEAEVVGQTL